MDSPTQHKIDEFFSKYPERHIARGQILIYAGDDPPGVFYLSSGQIKQYSITESGNENIVKVYNGPAIVPLSWVINRTPNNYFYECFSDAVLRRAPEDDLVIFLKDNPDVVYNLLSKIYASVENSYARMASMMGESTRNRVVIELLLECKKYGIQKPDGSYVLNLHESDIAARTGLSRETISRHLSHTDLEQLVEIGRKNITINDMGLLEKELDKNIA